MESVQQRLLSHAWFLTGPTAVGKTALSHQLAAGLNAEILSLDSMAVYRGMDLGTAKPTAAERSAVPHHLIDLCEPHEEFTIVAYRTAALQCVEELLSRGKTPLFVGGTPLYLKALLRGLFDGPPADWEFRRHMAERAESVGSAELHRELQSVDPAAAARIQPADLRRIIRALEVLQLTGQTMSRQQREFDRPVPLDACRVFVLDRPRAQLHDRINRRVEGMFRDGLIDETAKILQSSHGFGRTAAQAVGYHEVIDYLQGRCTLAEAITQTQIGTRQLAKWQTTWFRSLSECRTITINDLESVEALTQKILAVGKITG